MEGIIFDLKGFRLNQLNGMSQEDFAKQIGISQDKVSRMESDPKLVSLDIILKISQQFGVTLDDLIGLTKQQRAPLNVKNTWKSSKLILETIKSYIEASSVCDNYKDDIEELRNITKTIIRKPKVAFIGRSDVGKSTMINTLLGSDRMPAHWTPTTAIAVYVKHIEDRPKFMKNDEVWVFRSDDNGDLWDDSRLDDEDHDDEVYCKGLMLSHGNYDLLNTYGTRKGERFKGSAATAAVVFVDSPLLHNCDIIDLPGYGTGDEGDDALSLKGKSQADVIVYLSLANAFMRGEDMNYIRNAMNSLPDFSSCKNTNLKPLSNLFIVASQAHVVNNGNRIELNNILDDRCDEFKKSIPEDGNITKAMLDSLRGRFYTFTSNNQLLCTQFEQDFREITEALPLVVEQSAKDDIKNWAKAKDENLKKVIKNFEELLKNYEKAQNYLEECESNEPKRKAAFLEAKLNVLNKINSYQLDCKQEICDYYNQTIEVENLVRLMEQRDVKKKKSDLETFSSYVSNLLQDKTSFVIQEKSNKLSEDINDFLENPEIADVESINEIPTPSPFNKVQAFATGLAGVGTYGALAVWAASCGNLGGYILVAKGVSALAAIGIHVGGTAAAISAVASIGGPVVLGIALALIAAITTFSLTSGGWKKSIAKKMVEAFRSKRVLNSLQENSDKYWYDTNVAFRSAADSMNEKWESHIKDLRKQLDEANPKSVEKAIKEAEEMRNFLQNIPY